MTRLILVGLCAGWCSACSGLPSLASSQFEGDDEGWLLTGNGEATEPSLERSGGNPGGNICGVDKADGDLWYFVAPQKFLGNASSAYGKRLVFDLRQGNSFNQLRGRDVVLNGAGLALVVNFRATPGRDWTPYSFRIDETGGWLVDDTSGRGPPATAEEIKTALSNLTAIRIRGEFVDGPSDTACLDNVYWGTP